MYGFHQVQLLSNMAIGIFTLRQQLRGLLSKNWTGTIKTPYVEYLVVAGGGGGNQYSGAGGAGGVVTGLLPVTPGVSYVTTVGGGGPGLSNRSVRTNTGTNSSLSSVTALGGGAGGADNSGSPNPVNVGGAGGSGGGGTSTGGSPGGQGTFGQGNAGGKGTTAIGGSGGGGGAGTVGLDLTSSAGGNGGAGIASAISGTVTPYGGGGGGSINLAGTVYGAGGVGGGGRGGSTTIAPLSGDVNTGGGGGGDYQGGAGGAGGSGIVIVSYPDIYAALTTTGSPTVSTSGSGSLYFAGSSTGLILNSVNTYNNGTTDFTIEFWYYSNNSAGQQFDIIDGTGGNQYFTISMFANSGGAGTGACYFYNGSAYVGSGGAVNVPTGVWTHFAIVRSGSTVTFYTNGVSQASTTNSYVLGNTSYNAVFGKQGNATTASLVGYLSNFRYVNGTAIVPPVGGPTAPLTAVANTKILLNTVSGAAYADSSTNGYTSTTLTNLPVWNQLSPFATGLGYKNRVYSWTTTGSGTFTV